MADTARRLSDPAWSLSGTVTAADAAAGAGGSLWDWLCQWFQKMLEQENIGIYLIGLIAQLLFSARLLLQWLISERTHKVQSPKVYWILSIAGAWLLTLYGWFREDFSIILGQIITYYIYMWNLRAKKIWQPLPKVLRWVLALTPVIALLFCFRDADRFFGSLFRNPDIPAWLLVFGSLGQIVFTLRFVYQIIYSCRHGESVLPVGFWLLSLLGASTIMAYGIVRSDPVLILGQSFGWVAYLRNIMIWFRQQKKERRDDAGGLSAKGLEPLPAGRAGSEDGIKAGRGNLAD